jgi:hypothetical protein
MVAVAREHSASGDEVSAGGAHRAAPVGAHARRAVAVVVDVMELLRPQSHLVELLDGFSRVDVLVATEESFDADEDDEAAEFDEAEFDEDGEYDEADYDDEDPADGIAERVSELGLSEVSLHRLGLRRPLAASAEDDMVAALSELVGFDPEPGVYCLAPSFGAVDPTWSVAGRAGRRIAQVYGLPLMRYRGLELCVVGG